MACKPYQSRIFKHECSVTELGESIHLTLQRKTPLFAELSKDDHVVSYTKGGAVILFVKRSRQSWLASAFHVMFDKVEARIKVLSADGIVSVFVFSSPELHNMMFFWFGNRPNEVNTNWITSDDPYRFKKMIVTTL